jgi:hopanoid C-2 methylase
MPNQPINSSPLLDFHPEHVRRVLCVFPRYSSSFGTFNHAFPLMGDVKAFMPPQGILLIAALLPGEWEVKFVDENVRPVSRQEFDWADAVFTSGMHIQRDKIHDICHRAHMAGKLVALGGPSVSSMPEYYPDIDILHCGEAGDSTRQLFEYVDNTTQRPAQQIVLHTTERLNLALFPSPAYDLIDISQYLLGSVQFSSGCPFTCEFCDIPALYGRNPRLKTPEQIIRELDQLADGGAVSVYFVDDNFIGNPKAALELLPPLIEWQKRRDYQVRLSCEATLNISSHTEILKLMQEAFFTNIFCGIETPETGALKAIKKGQNLRTPILEAVDTLNRYGMEVASGIIMGFDTDTDETPQAIIDFAEQSHIPILTVNILYALPHTPLYDRLEKTGRLLKSTENRDSNIDFLIPYEQVETRWKTVIATVYEPRKLYSRYLYNCKHTYVHRTGPRHPLRQLTGRNIKRGLKILGRILWRIGFQTDYRKEFWKMTWSQLKHGNIENIFQVAMVAHHLVTYARECVGGRMQASNYTERSRRETREAAATFK